MMKKINYVVGFVWPRSEGAICTFSYLGEVNFGTIEDAKKFKRRIEHLDKDKIKEKRKYKIFKLVEVKE